MEFLSSVYIININTGRRISDLLNSRWSDFFYKNGSMRKTWDIKKKGKDGNIIYGEQKTGKSKELYLNTAIQEVFKIFLENEPGIDFAYDYDEPVFKQLHGTHKGKVLSGEGYRKALIKAGEQCLDYEIRSHSMRRDMGKMMMELHSGDNTSKSVLMGLLNHSSEKVTNGYLGETAKLEMQYLEDSGEKYRKYVMHGEEIPFMGKTLDFKDKTDPIKLTKLYNEILDGLEIIAR